MRNSNRKVLYAQWAIIAVLVAGGAVGGYLMVHKLSDLQDTNTTLSGDNARLQSQVDQAQTAAAATPSPTPSASPSPTPTVSASPAVAGAATTPKPTATPRRR